MIISLGSSGKVFPAPIQLHWCLLLLSLFSICFFYFWFFFVWTEPWTWWLRKNALTEMAQNVAKWVDKNSKGGIQWLADLWVCTFSSRVKMLFIFVLQCPGSRALVMNWKVGRHICNYLLINCFWNFLNYIIRITTKYPSNKNVMHSDLKKNFKYYEKSFCD